MWYRLGHWQSKQTERKFSRVKKFRLEVNYDARHGYHTSYSCVDAYPSSRDFSKLVGRHLYLLSPVVDVATVHRQQVSFSVFYLLHARLAVGCQDTGQVAVDSAAGEGSAHVQTLAQFVLRCDAPASGRWTRDVAGNGVHKAFTYNKTRKEKKCSVVNDDGIQQNGNTIESNVCLCE